MVSLKNDHLLAFVYDITLFVVCSPLLCIAAFLCHRQLVHGALSPTLHSFPREAMSRYIYCSRCIWTTLETSTCYLCHRTVTKVCVTCYTCHRATEISIDCYIYYRIIVVKSTQQLLKYELLLLLQMQQRVMLLNKFSSTTILLYSVFQSCPCFTKNCYFFSTLLLLQSRGDQQQNCCCRSAFVRWCCIRKQRPYVFRATYNSLYNSLSSCQMVCIAYQRNADAAGNCNEISLSQVHLPAPTCFHTKLFSVTMFVRCLKYNLLNPDKYTTCDTLLGSDTLLVTHYQ